MVKKTTKGKPADKPMYICRYWMICSKPCKLSVARTDPCLVPKPDEQLNERGEDVSIKNYEHCISCFTPMAIINHRMTSVCDVVFKGDASVTQERNAAKERKMFKEPEYVDDGSRLAGYDPSIQDKYRAKMGRERVVEVFENPLHIGRVQRRPNRAV